MTNEIRIEKFLYRIFLPDYRVTSEKYKKFNKKHNCSLHLYYHWDIVSKNRDIMLEYGFSIFIAKAPNYLVLNTSFTKKKFVLQFYIFYI